MKISELCHELNNYFDRGMSKFHGAVEIRNGHIVDTDFTAEIQPNQYFRIIGSVFNDGVWKNDNKLELTDELFVGQVWLMAVPKDFIDLVDEMTAWEAENNKAALSPFNSESFGGYSYTKSTAGNGGSGVNSLSIFKNRLNQWRKIR